MLAVRVAGSIEDEEGGMRIIVAVAAHDVDGAELLGCRIEEMVPVEDSLAATIGSATARILTHVDQVRASVVEQASQLAPEAKLADDEFRRRHGGGS